MHHDSSKVLSRLFRLDIAYFLKNGAWAGYQQVIGVACGLAISYIFGHYLPKNIFGEYNLVLSYTGLLTFLSLPGIDQAMPASIARRFDGTLPAGWKMKFRSSLIAVPIITAIAVYYFTRGQTSIGSSLLVAAIAFPFLYSYSIYTAFFTALMRFDRLAIFSILGSFVYLFLLGWAVIFQPSTAIISTAYYSAIILPAYAGYRKAMRSIRNNHIDRQVLGYGKFLTLLNALPWITGNIGNILIAGHIGIEALAVYAVASRFLTSVQKNVIVFYKPVTAKLASQSQRWHSATLSNHAGKLVILGISMTAVLWFMTPVLINFFFTASYAQAVKYGQWLSLCLLPLPLSWALNDMLVFQKLRRAQIISSLTLQLLQIALIIIIVPLYKLDGLVWINVGIRFADPILPLFFLLRHSRSTGV